MFGRSKNDAPPATEAVEVNEVATKPGGKGRPTPKRKDAQAARRVPIVPTDREAAKKAAREQARAQRIKQREDMAKGIESALPPRDRGPVKRFIRDSVDARWNIGEILMPLMLVVLAMSIVPNRMIQSFALLFVWLIIMIGVIDSVLLWRRLKKRITAKFGEEPPKGSAAYTVMRAFQMRMARMPKPQVKRGTKVS
ncbi:DUF3043 domain-containing protein [Calidifontibacter sp. DB0510]|uniref:DUF3043 domain-containing protein n=1 Tax=Metallococcus carri TaxID=1656884 RepID=A0A967EAJ9_9MICO|nr:DUF3043 domain-containing protein [Metallococcus carri]NHN55969.1 DUF3043 domain-containing protein [Metallococcus carri]NOP37574.1 DUF3043 domain-containing protein [Calidifontibacter sp. DB2511S]